MKLLQLAVAVAVLSTSSSAFSQSPPVQQKPNPEKPVAPAHPVHDRAASGGQTTGPDWKSKGVVGPFGLGAVGTLAVVAGVIVLIAAATDGGDSNPPAQH